MTVAVEAAAVAGECTMERTHCVLEMSETLANGKHSMQRPGVGTLDTNGRPPLLEVRRANLEW